MQSTKFCVLFQRKQHVQRIICTQNTVYKLRQELVFPFEPGTHYVCKNYIQIFPIFLRLKSTNVSIWRNCKQPPSVIQYSYTPCNGLTRYYS